MEGLPLSINRFPICGSLDVREPSIVTPVTHGIGVGLGGIGVMVGTLVGVAETVGEGLGGVGVAHTACSSRTVRV